ncbi:uncharacterized protein BP5553_06441 [Venustampulla echinocandica]|uniref:Heterokaryon incompatibility domain-containing protein n=1 Tax=Venustampulla echinocandica TaxID=2656787 RepID=A0A370TJZ2_9HELO|nr:uncharacterized protein BP5553_06441 [Venustampulla echinocandica]RDL35829.1 hypothetical protein BP5553_06441 [Venustampulla echinocandica]
MRLLNTTSFRVQDFSADSVPSYAILSHRWEHEEVSFQDLSEGRGPKMAGYSKITGCCTQAVRDGWEWVWVDSCCIDKTSSSELSEAINSMFKYYSDAKVCYVYLSDVPSADLDLDNLYWAFSNSKWFGRGWTLQELLAPAAVIFFDEGWTDLGSRNSMQKLLSMITGIQDFAGFKSASVAQKMSWAAKRQTSRPEDLAYCLMGLFGIHMPIIYGEGNKAFIRLQREIINISDDESIFAWTNGDCSLGLLATSPSAFENCGDVVVGQIPGFLSDERPPYSITSKGLRMEHIVKPLDDVFDLTFISLLNCRRINRPGNLAIYIYADRDAQSAFRYRNFTISLDTQDWREKFKKKTLYIQQRDPLGPGVSFPSNMLVRFGSMVSRGFKATQCWISDDSVFPSLVRQDRDIILPHSASDQNHDGHQIMLNETSRTAIAFSNSILQTEFMVFLAPSTTAPRAHIEDLPLKGHGVEEILNVLFRINSADYVSKKLGEKMFASVGIRPGLYQGQHIQIAEIVIAEGSVKWPEPSAVTEDVKFKLIVEDFDAKVTVQDPKLLRVK